MPNGLGYWLVSADGGVYSFGSAKFYGSVESAHVRHLAGPVVGIAAAHDGDGYWLVSSRGDVYSFGDARFFGPSASLRPRIGVGPIVGIVATPGGRGYWLVSSSGGVFSFGDASLSRVGNRLRSGDRRDGSHAKWERVLVGGSTRCGHGVWRRSGTRFGTRQKFGQFVRRDRTETTMDLVIGPSIQRVLPSVSGRRLPHRLATLRVPQWRSLRTRLWCSPNPLWLRLRERR